MTLQTLNDEISHWENTLDSLDKETKKKLLEIAFFKIFVKMELFLSNCFIAYSIGNSNMDGTYIPNRKLSFSDEKHLKDVLKGKNSFIDYIEKMESVSKHIFVEKQNPFDLIFLTATISDDLIKMKLIRNYIAHESEESKEKYTNKVLNGKFKKLEEYLNENKREAGVTYFTYYINKIREISIIISSPQSYL